MVHNAYSAGNIPLKIHAIANVKVHAAPHVIGGGEVQPVSARLEGDQENRRAGIRLEAIDEFLAVAGFSVEAQGGDAGVA